MRSKKWLAVWMSLGLCFLLAACSADAGTVPSDPGPDKAGPTQTNEKVNSEPPAEEPVSDEPSETPEASAPPSESPETAPSETPSEEPAEASPAQEPSPAPSQTPASPKPSASQATRPNQPSAPVTPSASPSPTPSAAVPPEEITVTGSDSESSESPGQPEPPAAPIGLVPESERVDDSWFSDAVFLGDSRTDGLRLYGGIRGASYLSHKGLSVFSVDDKKCIELKGKTVTVLDALAQGEYRKVYVMLGINEMGYQDMGAFKRAYSNLVASIREIQPQAAIYLQTLIPVNEPLVKTHGMASYINNERVLLFNDAITEVAEDNETALVNVWEEFAGEDGILSSDLTGDGVHMNKTGYLQWSDYLRTHTGSGQEPVSAPR